jgi:peptidoglycan/LPS O-acetylase OafA/YrhL
MKSKATHLQRESLLDLLRWIAALLVAFSHWASEVPYLFQSGLPNFLLPIAKVGGVGVPIFFIVSGYVISLTAAKKASGLRFAYARFVRLFPGLLISMLVVLVVGQRFISPYSQPVESLLASVSLTYDIFEIQPLTTVLWTLIVEVKFYFAITVILLIKKDIFQKPLWIATLLISLLILKETSLFGIYNYFNSQLLGNIEFFLLGISLHFSTRLVRKHALMALGFSILSATYVVQILDLDEFGIRDRIISFAIALIILSSYIQFPSKLATLLNSLGLASYPIYLVHTHLGTAMINVLYVRIENVTFVFLVGGVLALTLICISVNLFTEKPFQKALRRIERFN